METKVNKTMLIVASAVLAAATTWVPAAQAEGAWRTDAAEAPVVVDCETLPAFAKLKPTTELQIVSRPDDDQTGQPQATPPIKTVEKAPAGPGAKPTDCKKYFPSVGETLPVPCEG